MASSLLGPITSCHINSDPSPSYHSATVMRLLREVSNLDYFPFYQDGFLTPGRFHKLPEIRILFFCCFLLGQLRYLKILRKKITD